MIEEHEFIKAHPEEASIRRIPKTTPPPKPCINCHKIFQPLTHSVKACRSCMTIKCFNCGKDHSVKEYHMKKFQRFCSQECVTKYIGHNNRRIDQAILERIKTLRDQGLSFERIALTVGFSKYAVRTNLIREYGFHAVAHPSFHMDQTSLEAIKELSKNGFSSRKIATKLGIGKSTAAYYLKPANGFFNPNIKHRLVGKVDQAMLERMKALRDEGLNYKKIGSMTGLCRQTFKRHIRSYKSLVPIAHPNRKITEEMLEEAQTLKNQGLSYVQIGAQLDISANAIWKRLR